MIVFFLFIFFVTILPSISEKIPDELMEKFIIRALSDCSNTQLFCSLKLTSKKMNKLICDITDKNSYFCNYRFAYMMAQREAFFKYKCMHYLGFIAYPECKHRQEITDPYDLKIINKISAKHGQKNTMHGQNKNWLLLHELLPNKKNTMCAISTRIDFDYGEELKIGAKTYWDDFVNIEKLNTIYFDFEHYTGCQGYFSLPGVIEAFLDHYPQQYAKNIEILHIKNKSEDFTLDAQKFSNLRELFIYGQGVPRDQNALRNLPHLETLKAYRIPDNNAYHSFANIKTLILKTSENLDLANFPSLEFLQITRLFIHAFPCITPCNSLKKVILQGVFHVPPSTMSHTSPFFNAREKASNCIHISYFNNFIKKLHTKTEIKLEIQIFQEKLSLIDLSVLYTIWLKYVSTLYLIPKPYRVSSSFIIPTTLKRPYIILDPRNYKLTLYPVSRYSKKEKEILEVFKHFQKNKIRILNLTTKNKIFNDILLQLHDYFPHLNKLEIPVEIKKSMCELLFQKNELLKEIHTPAKIKNLSIHKSSKNDQNVKVVSRRKNNYWFDHLPHIFIAFLFLTSCLKYIGRNYFPYNI